MLRDLSLLLVLILFATPTITGWYYPDGVFWDVYILCNRAIIVILAVNILPLIKNLIARVLAIFICLLSITHFMFYIGDIILTNTSSEALELVEYEQY